MAFSRLCWYMRLGGGCFKTLNPKPSFFFKTWGSKEVALPMGIHLAPPEDCRWSRYSLV